MGTVETLKCRQDMLIPDKEACDFPGLPCKKNNGKCAADGLCCTHGKHIYISITILML